MEKHRPPIAYSAPGVKSMGNESIVLEGLGENIDPSEWLGPCSRGGSAQRFSLISCSALPDFHLPLITAHLFLSFAGPPSEPTTLLPAAPAAVIGVNAGSSAPPLSI